MLLSCCGILYIWKKILCLIRYLCCKSFENNYIILESCQ